MRNADRREILARVVAAAGLSARLMVVELVLANTMVEPSGAARAAERMAMTPLAPGRFVDHDLLAERSR